MKQEKHYYVKTCRGWVYAEEAIHGPNNRPTPTYAVYEPTEEGWQDLNQQFLQVNADLRRAGLEVVEAPEPVCDEGSCSRVAALFAAQDIDILHALIITWSFDHYTVRIQQIVGVPVAIHTIPGIHTGSIVGGQQLGCILADLEVEHRLFYGELGNLETSQEITIYAQACGLQRRLKGARFLMLGRRTPGMTPIAVDEVEIMRLFGARLVQMGMDEFADLAAKVPAAEAEAEWKNVSARAASRSFARYKLLTGACYSLDVQLPGDEAVSQ